MKISSILVVVAVAAISLTSCDAQKALDSAKINNDSDSVSFALGYSWGTNIKSMFPDINPVLVAQGISAAYAGDTNKLFGEDPMATDTYIRAYMNKAQMKVAKENLEKGQKFLEENKKKEGVIETESGLQYEVLVMGEGEKPTADSKVNVHYHGTTIDGVVFDSSVDRGEPISFPLSGVIRGWTEGVQLMPVGSKFKFYIPSELAYGERQAGPEIGPNSVLIFEVELLGIEAAEEAEGTEK